MPLLTLAPLAPCTRQGCHAHAHVTPHVAPHARVSIQCARASRRFRCATGREDRKGEGTAGAGGKRGRAGEAAGVAGAGGVRNDAQEPAAQRSKKPAQLFRMLLRRPRRQMRLPPSPLVPYTQASAQAGEASEAHE